MALTATLYQFSIELADVDRGVYESLSIKAAQHPSETEERLVTRVLAYCLEYREGIAFSKGGLSDPDEPAITVRDLTGALQAWIEVGAPDASRLHKANKAAPAVAVYLEKAPVVYVRQLAGEKIHRAQAMVLRAIDRELVDALVSRLDRRMTFALSVTDGHLFASFPDGTSLDGRVEPVTLPAD